MNDELMQRALLRCQIEEFYADYVACLDEDRLEDWPEYFTEDCTYGRWARENWDAGLPAPLFLCTNRKMLQDRVLAHTHANIFGMHWNRHIVSSIRLHASTDESIELSSNYVIVQTRESGESFVFQAGRSLDRLIHNAGTLRFVQRKLIYDTSQVRTQFVTPI